ASCLSPRSSGPARPDPTPGGSPMIRIARRSGWLEITALVILAGLSCAPSTRAGVTREEVERAIHDGVRYLKQQQREDGSWPDVEGDTKSGTTSLVTLALLTAGEKSDSPALRQALASLRRLGPNG